VVGVEVAILLLLASGCGCGSGCIVVVVVILGVLLVLIIIFITVVVTISLLRILAAVISSPPPKAASAAIIIEGDAAQPVESPSSPVETFTVGVTDYTFNPVNAIFGRLLHTSDGHVVTLAFWQQKELTSHDEIPYFEIDRG
jgi:hypothetical protein